MRAFDLFAVFVLVLSTIYTSPNANAQEHPPRDGLTEAAMQREFGPFVALPNTFPPGEYDRTAGQVFYERLLEMDRAFRDRLAAAESTGNDSAADDELSGPHGNWAALCVSNLGNRALSNFELYTSSMDARRQFAVRYNSIETYLSGADLPEVRYHVSSEPLGSSFRGMPNSSGSTQVLLRLLRNLEREMPRSAPNDRNMFIVYDAWVYCPPIPATGLPSFPVGSRVMWERQQGVALANIQRDRALIAEQISRLDNYLSIQRAQNGR